MTEEAYGKLDQWREPAAFDEATARDFAGRIERRAQSADEATTRAAYLDLLEIRPGERALDVGCGSGVVARDLVRRVGPVGGVVGVDPSPAFLAIARELATTAGLADQIDFRLGDARALPFDAAEFDVAVAATTLSHVPDAERAIPELARVLRPGGRAGIFDLDTDSFILNHPDRDLTRRIVGFLSNNGAIHGWLGRRLPGLLAAAGFEIVQIRAFTALQRDPEGFYAGVITWGADQAVAAGAITSTERDQWLATLREIQSAGQFLAGQTYLFTWGAKSTS
ncbi:MAG: methyltransferase domain-containing protein [Chloroflexi bacterium]|nr:methyltransferase domain-containing protein [Chloroflexota bacterium]